VIVSAVVIVGVFFLVATCRFKDIGWVSSFEAGKMRTPDHGSWNAKSGVKSQTEMDMMQSSCQHANGIENGDMSAAMTEVDMWCWKGFRESKAEAGTLRMPTTSSTPSEVARNGG
jgi:hypothetical protein